MTDKKQEYGAETIKVLEGLEAVRKNFDVIEISKKIKKAGDVLILSNELKIKPRTLALVKEEGRILSHFPKIHKSKSSALSRLRTNRELELFSKKYDIYNTSVRNLIKLVRWWNKEVQINPFMLVTQEEHDLIIGSSLGDASIRKREKNSCFRFSHSMKQKEYSKWKMQKLINFNISEFREVKRKIRDTILHAIDFSTKTHPVFNYYRDLFYKSGDKKVTKEILNQLNPRSLAIWICDDGSFCKKQNYFILCTYSFSLDEHKLLKEFFNNKFGLNPTIGLRDHKYYYLRFKKEDSKRLIELIKPFIPKCMLYKIGEQK